MKCFKKKLIDSRGISAIELIVYITLFAVLSVAVLNALIVTMRSFSETRSNHDLLNGGLYSMERMTREIRNAESVDILGSTFASNPGVLALTTRDIVGNPKTVIFSRSGTSLIITENGVVTGTLTGQNVDLTNLMFYQTVTVKGSVIKIEMTVQDNRSLSRRSENFYNTITLRGGYQ